VRGERREGDASLGGNGEGCLRAVVCAWGLHFDVECPVMLNLSELKI
jgi:hypothetical protein